MPNSSHRRLHAFRPFCVVTMFLSAIHLGLCVVHAIEEPTLAQTERNVRRRISSNGLEIWEGRYDRPIASFRGYAVGPAELIITKIGYVMNHKDYVEVGTVKMADATVALTITHSSGDANEVVRDFAFIRWSPRAFLVDAKYLIGFCNEVNSGRRPEGTYVSTVLIKESLDTGDPKGAPVVPEAYRKYLVSTPLLAHVLSFGDHETDAEIPSLAISRMGTKAVVEVKGDARLLPGLELWSTDEAMNTLYRATVLDVSKARTTCIIERVFGKEPIKKDMAFSTRFPSLGVLTGKGVLSGNKKADKE